MASSRWLLGCRTYTLGVYGVKFDLNGKAVRSYTGQKQDYLNRLRRVEGEVRALQRMVDQDTSCIDVLTHVPPVTKALQGVAVGILDEHVRGCVRDAALADDADRDLMVKEAARAIERLAKA